MLFGDDALDTVALDLEACAKFDKRDVDALSNRYCRITPAFIRALTAYLGFSMKQFMEMLGFKTHDYVNFTKSYHPKRSWGSQVSMQCGIFWITKLLYRNGHIPFSLAQLGGVHDANGARREAVIMRRITGVRSKNKTKR